MAAGASSVNGETDQYAVQHDEGHEPHRDGVHQRIRANSSIMQMRKILGTASHPSLELGVLYL